MDKCIERKIEAVKELSEVIKNYQANVENVEYHVMEFDTIDNARDVLYEFVVINYKGGAKTVRCSNANSFSAILQDVAKYLNSGYYTEVSWYNSLKERCNNGEGIFY